MNDLDREEYIEQEYQKLDVNKNGIIDEKEFIAYSRLKVSSSHFLDLKEWLLTLVPRHE